MTGLSETFEQFGSGQELGALVRPRRAQPVAEAEPILDRVPTFLELADHVSDGIKPQAPILQLTDEPQTLHMLGAIGRRATAAGRVGQDTLGLVVADRAARYAGGRTQLVDGECAVAVVRIARVVCVGRASRLVIARHQSTRAAATWAS